MEEEVWKDILGYEGSYQVSNLGRVKSLSREMSNGKTTYMSKEKILKYGMGTDGYLLVNLYKNKKGTSKQIHKLVAIAFHNHTPCGYKLVVNHKDLNRLNNKASNLEIITNRENTSKKHIKSSSRYVGVYLVKETKKWCAQITINNKSTHIGLFDDELEASKAYQNKVKELNNKNK